MMVMALTAKEEGKKEERKEERRNCLVSTAFVCDPNREARVQRQK
jgi:hypothetical protein